MARFEMFPLVQFETGKTGIRRPKHFLQFSFDDKHKLHVDSDESLRYYYPPYIAAPGVSIPDIRLSKGYNTWIQADDSIDSHLDALLETIMTHEQKLLAGGTNVEDVRTKADVITWRGMMTKIFTTGYDMFSDFEMNATCYQDTIYIEENFEHALFEERKSDKRVPRSGQQPQWLMQYWGYKFEALSVLGKPWAECSREEVENRDEELVNNNRQYCSIVLTGIGSTSLIIGGEVDCIEGEMPSNPDEPIPWVELKTSAELPNNSYKETQKFERKLVRFWAQSFLLGVPKIVVGFRTNDGHLTRIVELDTLKIPGEVTRGHNMWNGNVCINMTAAFLDLLKKTIMGTGGVWRIRRKKDKPAIEIFQIEETGTGNILEPEFIAHRQKLLAAELEQKLAGGAKSPSNPDD